MEGIEDQLPALLLQPGNGPSSAYVARKFTAYNRAYGTRRSAAGFPDGHQPPGLDWTILRAADSTPSPCPVAVRALREVPAGSRPACHGPRRALLVHSHCQHG
ncbi:hypothetical protein [Streptomyces sp. YIM 121038]|uniref:hypothetical protein n=1 Tax=Streptomyces sp. YIM 121038 TaxID=2136401 RepID=UPI00111001D5|nr:hypothetical protein [Streptomyces sp. YIM 121038]